METLPIVKRKDEKQYGEYPTKRVILEIYDEMKRAIEMGPADPSVIGGACTEGETFAKK